MRKSTKGFYTLEAVIFLPFVILAVLSLGYFMKVEGTWERCVYEAIEESSYTAMKAYDGISHIGLERRIEERIFSDNKNLDYIEIENMRNMYSGIEGDGITSYSVKAGMRIDFPLGFERQFELKAKIKYRNFVGKRYDKNPLGDGLEKDEIQERVWIFPYSGERYHDEKCTYVKTNVEKKRLNNRIKKKYKACGLCDSGQLKSGSVVYCFKSEGTAYHRGTCKSINKHTIVIDKRDAEKRGYMPCSKCGGR